MSDLYSIPQEMQDFRATIREIVAGADPPARAEIDRHAASTRGTSASCWASRTSSGLPFAEEYGGTGTGTLMLQIGGRGDRPRVRLLAR